MGTFYCKTNTGEAVSTTFTIDRTDRALMIQVPSLTVGGAVGIQFTHTGSVPWHTLVRPDGSGLPWIVSSGPGPAWAIINHPSPATMGRFTVPVQNVVASYTLFTIRD